MSASAPHFLVASTDSGIMADVFGALQKEYHGDYVIRGAISQPEAEVCLAGNEYDLVIIDYSNDDLSPELVERAKASGSSPEVIVLIDWRRERRVTNDQVPIGIWSMAQGAYAPVSIVRAFAEPMGLLRLQARLALSIRDLRGNPESQILDAVEERGVPV